MKHDLFRLIDQLKDNRRLPKEEMTALLEGSTPQTDAALAAAADSVRRQVYGNAVFIRGLIEVSNYCKNDCLYCGIRRSSQRCERYRLTEEEIRHCTEEGYRLGFRTFVLQSGEDPYWTDERLCPLLSAIKQAHPDCAITLSLGERSEESYRRLYKAGGDRYLLRHETADAAHYAHLHPKEMSLETRLECLRALRRTGFQVGCGMMVGSPGQSIRTIVSDLQLIEELQPEMCGIGPFIPHHETPFAGEKPGTPEETCRLLSIMRLMRPNILLPATTALGSIGQEGREKGIRAGANVVMPNLSPDSVRKKYDLYDNKLSTGVESAEHLEALRQQMEAIGYRVVVDRGDAKPMEVGKQYSQTF